MQPISREAERGEEGQVERDSILEQGWREGKRKESKGPGAGLDSCVRFGAKRQGTGEEGEGARAAVSKDSASDPKSREGRILMAFMDEHGKSTEPPPLDERITFARGSDLVSTDEDGEMEEKGEDERDYQDPFCR